MHIDLLGWYPSFISHNYKVALPHNAIPQWNSENNPITTPTVITKTNLSLPIIKNSLLGNPKYIVYDATKKQAKLRYVKNRMKYRRLLWPMQFPSHGQWSKYLNSYDPSAWRIYYKLSNDEYERVLVPDIFYISYSPNSNLKSPLECWEETQARLGKPLHNYILDCKA